MEKGTEKTKLSAEEVRSRQRLRNRIYYKKYIKRKHGEVYYQIRYGDQYTLSAQAFTNLPSRMTREEASEYYGKKLNKVWRKIYGGVR